MNRHYNDKENVDYMIENLESNGRYEKTKESLIGTVKTFTRSLSNTSNAVFPCSLNITALANTIMSNYSEQEALP